MHRRTTIGAALAVLALVASATPAFASTTVFTQAGQFTDSHHFPPNPACGPGGGTTEYVSGSQHFHYTDLGTSVSVSYSEAVKITDVPDDPSELIVNRQATDAWAFQLSKDGSTLYHESFHDNGATFDGGQTYVMIRFYTTVRYVGGEVVIDHTFGANFPPEGC